MAKGMTKRKQFGNVESLTSDRWTVREGQSSDGLDKGLKRRMPGAEALSR
jgi:hypothetical protein